MKFAYFSVHEILKMLVKRTCTFFFFTIFIQKLIGSKNKRVDLGFRKLIKNNMFMIKLFAVINNFILCIL